MRISSLASAVLALASCSVLGFDRHAQCSEPAGIYRIAVSGAS